ncbi:MORN repeat-containing protein 5 [Habropoda laboriosa]|uniref:MORN repeat-containing protein 5 n=1 Tax=Habropoda laboriosa TaxID=597456 RepID=A0A0L7QKN2_9HYME|nr:MORN repeat-containing protein 5 [Habropoda laboriosa]
MSLRLKSLEEETRFVDGSEYRGTWNELGMEGIGKFILPHGTVFEGEFRDGTFHGRGSAYWPRGQRVDGIWYQGECKDKRYIFDDGLNFRNKDWEYCKFPDRRYLACLKYGLKPAGATLRTNKRNGFVIPPMCYDSGIGIFNPRTRCITSYRDSKKKAPLEQLIQLSERSKILKIPDTKFAQWVEKNCQKAWLEPIGNREDLYENWFSHKFHAEILSTLLPFSNNSFEPWWKRYYRYER